MRALSVLSFLTLAACNAGIGANAGRGDNHPPVCQDQSDMAKAGLVDGRPQSISCPEHGIGSRYNY